jgi:hypothetical protein
MSELRDLDARLTNIPQALSLIFFEASAEQMPKAGRSCAGQRIPRGLALENRREGLR